MSLKKLSFTSTTMKHHDFIRTYQALTPTVCDGLISLFNDNSERHIRNDNNTMLFTEFNVTKHVDDLTGLLVQAVMNALDKYLEDTVKYNQFLPPPYQMEEFRIKRYLGDTDEQFRWHSDVGDIHSAKRYLALLFYLNDDYDEGETEFVDMLVTPKKGDVLIFPPTWQYAHRGLPPINGDKYIMSSYLNYT